MTLYLGTALGIGMLYWSCLKAGGQFQVSSENVHMIARYFPSILGTANVILFRQTVREFIRMTPYVIKQTGTGSCHSVGECQWGILSLARHRHFSSTHVDTIVALPDRGFFYSQFESRLVCYCETRKWELVTHSAGVSCADPYVRSLHHGRVYSARILSV